jgi:hypothetical protein
MSSRTKKITKNAQIEVLHEKLDEFGQAIYYVNMYMEKYGLVKHYHSFIQASAEDKPLPNKLLFSDEEMPRETKAEVI